LNVLLQLKTIKMSASSFEFWVVRLKTQNSKPKTWKILRGPFFWK
jgi:hypothetical protein